MTDLDLLPSKLLALFVRPDFWLWLGLLTVLLALHRGWIKLARWVTWSIVIAVTLVGFYPVGSLWLAPLENRFPVNPSLAGAPSAIIVLGGGEEAAISSAWGQVNINDAGDRLTRGVERALEYPDTPLLFTGRAFNPLNDPSLVNGADQAASLFRQLGLPEDRVQHLGKARRTAEHTEDIVQMLDQLGVEPSAEQPLLIITSAFHMPRTIGVLCQAGFRHLVADPTDFRTTPGRSLAHRLRWNYANNLGDLKLAFREWAGLIAYHLKGHTPNVFPSQC
ncbi:MAG: YdcF family protein [Pseudomonadota bacterium]